jgi:hypothetical protein
MITRTSTWGLQDTRKTSTETKSALVKKYRKIFIEKLSRADLEELQRLLKKQFSQNRVIIPANKLEFELKLRKYFHEEIMRREIASIETLIEQLKTEDLP